MKSKKCLVFETLGKVSDMNLIKESNDGLTRLSGIFGVCGVKNQNNRIYSSKNYGLMVENLQKEIAGGSVLGELEHPNSMNINLENVSHKIEAIQMNEDGTITGTIVLLDTPKGRIAKAIAEASGSLYISSRGAGSIDESGNVTLTTIKTYDLVGTPGFSQAKLKLNKGQKLESLCESAEDGTYIYAIVEGEDDDLLDDSKDDKSKADKDDKSKADDTSKDDDSKDDNSDNNDNKNNDNKDATMNDLKEAIDKLSEKIESLTADLHVAQESLTEKDNKIKELTEKLESIPSVNYSAVEQWVKEEFAPAFKESLMSEIDENIDTAIEESEKSLTESIAEGVENWTVNEFAPIVEGYLTEEFAPVIENYMAEEFAPVVENWVTEEFAPVVEGWVAEEFAPVVEGWVNEELMPTVDKWINEECLPEHKESIVNEVNNNVNEFLESKNADKLTSIDNLLEAIESKGADDAALELLKEQKENDKFKGVYVVENMPAQYKPQWEMLSENKKNEIIRQSRMYDFTKAGIMEKFWDTVDFNEHQTIVETKVNPETNYQNAIASQMRRLGIR